MTPTVAVLDRQYARYVELLATAGVAARGTTDPDDVLRFDPSPEILLAAPDLAAAVLGGLDRLRWMQSTWAGVEQVVAAGIPQGVAVSRAAGIFGPAMREFVFGHLLAHAVRVVERTQAGRWDGRPAPSLAGTRIGILGTGSIGTALAETAVHFGMRVTGCSRSGRQREPFGRVYPVAEVREFAAGLHHLVAVLPATPETRHLVDAGLLAQLAPAATFVNVGRGSTAKQEDVVAALSTRQLSLAVLDVLEQEPLEEGDPLWSVDGLVITSHTAAWSDPVEVARLFTANLERWISGEVPSGLIDARRGY